MSWFMQLLGKSREVQKVQPLLPPPSVVVENLTIRYRATVAIQQANLRAAPGEVLALVGPSGCGKSSLLAAINRMTNHVTHCSVAGAILLDDFNILTADTDLDLLRRNIGMVFQNPNPFPLSIAENITFPLKDHGMRDKHERAAVMQSVLEQTGLWQEVKDRLRDNALRLSGGQQQRLCFARALALQPRVLLLDEPCSALDPISTAKIEQLIHSLKGRVTMLMVTHNLAQARRVADQVAVCWMDKGCGCVVECGATQNIFERPLHPVTKEYCLGRVG